MALVTCPDCRQSISDAAQACVHCGRPIAERSGMAGPGQQYPFFPVATHKFIVLSLCTLNLYALYWCYKNWRRIRGRTGEKLSPFWRAFFAPFWGFSLFGRIGRQAQERGISVRWSSGFLAAIYLLVSSFGAGPEPWWLISLASFLPLIPVVQTTRLINDAEPVTESRNEAYSGANVAAILFGGLILVLAVAGTLSPEAAIEVEMAPETTGWMSILDRWPAWVNQVL